MKNEKIPITAAGYAKVRTQLEELQLKRPTVLRDLQEVSDSADWRENAQLILLQNELGRIDTEIYKLAKLLEQSEIVAADNKDTIVDVGEEVVIQTDGEVEAYTIVSPAESAPDVGRISYESPLGRALLKHAVGDEITVNAPVGLLHYRIIAVN
ncbi:MAG: GreA/GreB family elongation factor [Caldilineaceae bacterium]